MFWSTNSVSSTHLETLLSKEDVTLKELMDEEEVLQECKSQNKKLIDFLIRSDVLEELVRLTTVEPTDDGNENMKYKYPNIACELLTCEVPQLNQRLANDEALLGKLYSFLEADPPLNPLLASFFSKTFSVLIARTSEQNWYSYQFTCLQVLEFLKSKENCVSLLLKHLGTSAIMDLLFKLITKVEGGEMKQNILNWLDDQKLVQNVMALLDPSIDSNVHCNAAQLLCDVIRTARENKKQATEQDVILERLESPETVSQLLDHILKEPKCETSIVGGISVLLTLLECDTKDTNEILCNPYGSLAPADDVTPEAIEPSQVVTNTIQAILPRLVDFHDVLINPPLKPAVMTTIGLLDPPLGNTRVEVAKLLSVLVANNNLEINNKLAELDTINILLDLFFKYTWNNFLHTQVEQCLAFALNADISSGEGEEVQKNSLIAHVLVKCRLLQRILEAWQDNEVQQTVNKLPRRGYMGHLIKISNNIVQQAEKGPLGALIKETVDSETLNSWEEFVKTKLSEINVTYKTCLGGVHPAQSSNDDNSAEGKDVSFNLDTNLQELYTNYYQLQALASPFTEQFGSYHEEQFNDNEDVLNSSGDPNLQKSFNINEEDLDQQAVLFEQVCAQKFQTLDDDDGDIWSKRIASSKGDENQKNDDWGNIFENMSSDEEDEDDPPERSGPEGREDTHTETSALPTWPGENEVVPPLQDTNPWGTTAPPPSEINSLPSPDQGWANFESAPFVANFGLNLSSDINTTIASSGSCEIDTIPLDLTPSDSNVNVNDMFSKENDEMEAPQVVENVPMTAVVTDVETISNEMKKLNIEDESQNVKEANSEDVKEVNDSQVNSFEKPEIVGDVNTVTNANDQEELIDNFRFLSNQGLITKCEENSEIEPESGGDGYQFLKENVQAVPNETTQTSNKNMDIIGSHSPPVTTTNGPV